MEYNPYDLLPEEISDEVAAHLADIFMNLALSIESRYYGQIVRYYKTCVPPCSPEDSSYSEGRQELQEGHEVDDLPF